MAILGVLFVAGSLAAFGAAIGLYGSASRKVRQRLGSETAPKAESSATVALGSTSELGVARYLVPSPLVAKAERNLVLAGRPDGWTLRRVLTAKVVFAAVVGLLGSMVYAAQSGGLFMLLAMMAVVIGYVTPDVLLSGRATARQEAIRQELPDILDQANISIEAGLSFEGALARVGESGDGPLAEELMRTVQDMRLGMSRKESYAALAERTTVEDVQRFTRSIVQAEEFGVSVSGVVRTQAAEMRMKRRYRAEAKALQVPVKMLFPLLVCLLPVLFIVILAPAAISIATTL